MRRQFDQQLALLNRELIEMGALCEEVIALASKALTEGDPDMAARVAPLDTEIDQKERTIESLCLKLLLQQQLQAQGLDGALLLVDLGVQGGHPGGHIGVSLRQGLGGQGDDLLAQGTHFNQLPVQQRQLLVKLSSHYPNLPVM